MIKLKVKYLDFFNDFNLFLIPFRDKNDFSFR